MFVAEFETDGESIRFIGEGHAGYAEYGQDIVCSAISALSYALAFRMEEAYNNNLLVSNPFLNLSNGQVEVEVTPTKEAYAVILEDFHFVQSGLLGIEDSYPGYIDIVSMLG